MKTWVDGQLVLEETNMLWRKYDNITINALYISTFFGGSDDTWGSPQDQVLRTCQCPAHHMRTSSALMFFCSAIVPLLIVCLHAFILIQWCLQHTAALYVQ